MLANIRFDTDDSYVVEIAAIQQLVSRTISNVFHIAIKNGVPAVSAVQNAANVMVNAWIELAPHLSKSWRLSGFTYRVATSAGNQGVDLPMVEHVVGSSGSALLPRRTTGIVTFKTGVDIPRSSRKFMSGFTESGNEREGQPTTAVVQAMQSWGNAFTNHNFTYSDSDDESLMLDYVFCATRKADVPGQVVPSEGNLDGSAVIVTHWEPWISAIARNQWKGLRRRG